ncbi:TrkH family potassium uptake protein [uncultured Bacteroides sp.]|uniref:TrkH family potassium uptake protein n=1 Tax=uncultured Bacteroides sp. TaxID=162156 RepID=UPI0025D4ED35|nr:TrkH family potassium uptake protein [uncultured Bacteroides sp.]
MINSKIIYHIMGFLLLIETAMLLCCGGISFFYREDDLQSFLISSAITTGASLLLLKLGQGAERTLNRREGYVIVSLAWVVFSVFGMLPFCIGNYIPNLADAFFETMSGFSSTGATILDNIESMPHGILFWRSLTQWVGGLGIIFFTIAVLPIFGVSGVQVFAAEASGPTHDKVHPRIGITAKWIWSIYAGLTGTLTVLLFLGGMSPFDSVCHALTTTSTGGFSTRQSSIAFYNSPYMEYVLSLFMFLSGINFTLLLLVFKRKIGKVANDAELRFYFKFVLFFTLFIAGWLYRETPIGMEEALRKALFQVVSLQTSTGFATADYMQWPPILWGCLAVIMVVGACAGSTTGGIKCIRMVILFKIVKNEFKHILHPNAVLPIRINKQVISSSTLSTVLAFSFLYVVIAFVCVLILMGLGVDFMESVGVVISSISNMGPGLGLCGPAYSWSALPDAAKWLLSFLMLLGRLELFTVLLLFTSDFWKKS